MMRQVRSTYAPNGETGAFLPNLQFRSIQSFHLPSRLFCQMLISCFFFLSKSPHCNLAPYFVNTHSRTIVVVHEVRCGSFGISGEQIWWRDFVDTRGTPNAGSGQSNFGWSEIVAEFRSLVFRKAVVTMAGRFVLSSIGRCVS